MELHRSPKLNSHWFLVESTYVYEPARRRQVQQRTGCGRGRALVSVTRSCGALTCVVRAPPRPIIAREHSRHDAAQGVQTPLCVNGGSGEMRMQLARLTQLRGLQRPTYRAPPPCPEKPSW